MKKTKDNNTSRRSVIKNNFWMLGKVWKYTPGYIIFAIIEGVVWGIHHSIGIIYVRHLFDSLEEHTAFEKVANIIFMYAAYLLVFYMFHYWYWGLYNPKVKTMLGVAMHKDMFDQAVRMDLSKYDDPAFYNDFIWSMEKSETHAAGLVEDTGKLINRIVASLTVGGVLFSIDITMTVIILSLTVLRMTCTFINNRTNLKYRDELNPLNRKSEYIKRVYKLPDYAKDIRISRVSENLFDMHDDVTEEKKTVIKKYGKKFAALSLIQNTINVVGDTSIIILMLYKVMVSGEVGLGGFAVAINAFWKMSWMLRDMVNRLLKYHEHGIFIEKILNFMKCEPTILDGDAIAPSFETLSIKGLSFSYTDGDKKVYALRDVDLEIKKGEKIAIVGYNGAGKTTLTKLLMRLYDASEGEILYNGKNIKEFTIESLRHHVSAVFQDYKIFACSIAENVVGGIYTDTMKEKVIDALRESEFSEKLSQLGDGIDTHLTREFDKNGTQLSGGEQQKVAISRAFYKNADLIILDEPSSALDPDAEYALNKAISEYTTDKTVIFISHRLSTTRHADRIYMFENGQIIESGTHEELINANGKYAYMFNLQAEKYRS